MSWLFDEKGCGKCESCGMDMDMAPFCVNNSVLSQSAESGKPAPFGLGINASRLICKGDLFTPRAEIPS